MRSIVPKLAVIGTTMATALFWSTPAQAQAWACGATVSGTVNLNHDLHCHGDGLVLLHGSLNLHGHTIYGDGTGTGVAVAGDTGTADAAAITNGTITGFVVGVEHLGSDDLTLNLTKLEVSGHLRRRDPIATEHRGHVSRRPDYRQHLGLASTRPSAGTSS